jgi:2-methylisocitrate lyase-like PEP mutase family enzyme
MSDQPARARAFAALHVKGDPLVLFNCWDAGSAVAVAEAGAKALATGSWSVAAAHGYEDGEKLPLDLAIANLARIVDAVDLPVSLDMEGGYGASPAAVAASAREAIGAGGIGCNFEDRIVGGSGLHSTEDQSARIRAMREAADDAGVPFFINARTDIFLGAKPETHGAEMVDAALERARAYADAGASGFFAPGLADEGLIEKLCEASPLPVNIMVLPYTPPRLRLAQLGVARISHGPGPYRAAMAEVARLAREAMGN